jgi:hypothetical protein
MSASAGDDAGTPCSVWDRCCVRQKAVPISASLSELVALLTKLRG